MPNQPISKRYCWFVSFLRFDDTGAIAIAGSCLLFLDFDQMTKPKDLVHMTSMAKKVNNLNPNDDLTVLTYHREPGMDQETHDSRPNITQLRPV